MNDNNKANKPNRAQAAALILATLPASSVPYVSFVTTRLLDCLEIGRECPGCKLDCICAEPEKEPGDSVQ
jgi:hypothetical protein